LQSCTGGGDPLTSLGKLHTKSGLLCGCLILLCLGFCFNQTLTSWLLNTLLHSVPAESAFLLLSCFVVYCDALK